MQKLYNLDKWRSMGDGDGVHFLGARPRMVRVEVNARQKSALYLIDHTGEIHFLALVEGRDMLEFSSSGPFTLTADNPSVMIYTSDGDQVSHEAVAAVTFTKIMQRRARNPELELMFHNMNAQLERTIAKQTLEFERRLAGISAARTDNKRTGKAGGSVEQPPSSGGSGAPEQVAVQPEGEAARPEPLGDTGPESTGSPPA